MEDPRPRGRPKYPLDERVGRALQRDELNFSDDQCWHGPRKLMVNGKNTSLLRSAFVLMLRSEGRLPPEQDELHPSWVIKRPNPAPCQDATCRNPRHWTLELRAWRGRGQPYAVEPLPFVPDVKQDDVEDAALYEIITLDNRREMTASEFATRFGTYNVATYAAAMEFLRGIGEL